MLAVVALPFLPGSACVLFSCVVAFDNAVVAAIVGVAVAAVAAVVVVLLSTENRSK